MSKKILSPDVKVFLIAFLSFIAFLALGILGLIILWGVILLLYFIDIGRKIEAIYEEKKK